MMSKRDDLSPTRAAKRAALTEALGDIVLQDGLDALSLRPAAARLGTSDRMLLYYFGTKAGLIADTLTNVSARLASKLATLPTSAQLSPFQMIGAACSLLADPEVRPFMALWTEIVARAVRGDDVFREVASRTMTAWIEWIEARTVFPRGIDPRLAAVAMLTVVEGVSAFDMIAEEVVDPSATLAALQACVAAPET